MSIMNAPIPDGSCPTPGGGGGLGGCCEILCDEGNGNQEFVRIYAVDELGAVFTVDVDIDGNPYVVTGPVVDCCGDDLGSDVEFVPLCDDGTSPVTPFLRQYSVAIPSGVVTTTDTELDGTTPYVLVGSAVVCGLAVEVLRSGSVNIFGAGSWTLGVDSGGGRVTSVTFACLRAGSVGPPPAAGSVTTTDDFGNTETLFPGQTKTWEVDATEDALTGTLVVTTTAVADIVTVVWTEV